MAGADEVETLISRVNGSELCEVLVCAEIWSASYKGKVSSIDFSSFDLPLVIILAGKSYLREKLLKVGPQGISRLSRSLKVLAENWNAAWVDFSSLKFMEWMRLWDLKLASTSRDCRSEIRAFYNYCARNEIAGADEIMGLELSEWVASNPAIHYQDIIQWHQERGALTSAEQEVVRREIIKPSFEETHDDNYLRLVVWTCFETLKRPSQLIEMECNALWVIESNSGEPEYFLWIPKAKRQLGRRPEPWPITRELASAIESFSSRPGVRDIQRGANALLVSSRREKTIQGDYRISKKIKKWAQVRNIQSPRTGRSLKLTLYRIRHSGATKLAMQGVSSEEIQYILEHDKADACQAYIDAVGSELCPQIEKANRRLGMIFSRLNELAFKGTVSEHLGSQQILVPVYSQPAVIGSCGLDGACDKHPFFKCYDGCRYFVAWQKADHQKSLNYIKGELERWSEAEGMHERSKAIMDFERVYTAISDVVNIIAEKDNLI